MSTFQRWSRWSWEDIYVALSRERLPGGSFEVQQNLVKHPLRCGAICNTGKSQGWDYALKPVSGPSLYIRELGDRFVAFLDPVACTESACETSFDFPVVDVNPAYLAAAGVFLILLGGLWSFVESAVVALS